MQASPVSASLSIGDIAVHQGAIAATVIAGVLLLMATGILVALATRWILEHEFDLWAFASRILRYVNLHAPFKRLQKRFPRVFALLRRHFATGEYLGLHLSIGIILTACGLFGFIRILRSVMGEKGIVKFDEEVADVLHAHAKPAGIAFWSVVSWLGTYPVMTVLGVTLGVILYRRKERMVLAIWFPALLGAHVLNATLKWAVHRDRPVFDLKFAMESTYSFPSGHALGAILGYGLIGYALWRLLHTMRARISITILLSCLVIAIGYSRLYLGVHYFSDVIGGYAVGGAWLAACLTGLVVARHQERNAQLRQPAVSMYAPSDSTLPASARKLASFRHGRD